jgi:hypothetical protein
MNMKAKVIKKEHAQRLTDSIKRAIAYSQDMQLLTCDSPNPQTHQIFIEHQAREEALVSVLQAIQGDFVNLELLTK